MPVIVFRPIEPIKGPLTEKDLRGPAIISRMQEMLDSGDATYEIISTGESKPFNCWRDYIFQIHSVGKIAKITLPSNYIQEVKRKGKKVVGPVQVLGFNMFQVIEAPGTKNIIGVVHCTDEKFVTEFQVRRPKKK